MAEDAEYDPSQRREPALGKQLGPGRFESPSISDSRRTDRLTASAAETGIEMIDQRAVRSR
jgi:hypothetical protein